MPVMQRLVFRGPPIYDESRKLKQTDGCLFGFGHLRSVADTF
jgi:hypothetical protein